MDIFLKEHAESILGVIEGFDRIIFKGYLTSMFPDGAFGRYLYKRGVLLKDAGQFFESETETLIQHAKTTAEQAGRPYRYLESLRTRTPAVNQRKRWPRPSPSKTGSLKAWSVSSRCSNLVFRSPSWAIARHNAGKSSGGIAGACTCTGI